MVKNSAEENKAVKQDKEARFPLRKRYLSIDLREGRQLGALGPYAQAMFAKKP